MERKEELEDLLAELSVLRERIKEESRKWWWLESGYAPILSVTKFVEDRKSIRSIVMNNQDLLTAFDIIIDNLKMLLKAHPKKVKMLHYNRVKEDIETLKKVIENIRDANRLIGRLEAISEFGGIYIDTEGEKIRVERITEEIIRQIIEKFKDDPLGWEETKKFFERVANNLEKKVLKDI